MWKKKKNKKLKKNTKITHNSKKYYNRKSKDLWMKYVVGLFIVFLWLWVLLIYLVTKSDNIVVPKKVVQHAKVNEKLLPQAITKKIERKINHHTQKTETISVNYKNYTYKAKLMPDWHYWLIDNIKHILTWNTYCYDNKNSNCINYGRLYESNALIQYEKKLKFIATNIKATIPSIKEHQIFKAQITWTSIQLNTGDTYMFSWWKLYKQQLVNIEKTNICSMLWTWWDIPTDKDYLNLEKSLWCSDFLNTEYRCKWLWWKWNKLWWLVQGLYGRMYNKLTFWSEGASVAFWTKDGKYRNLSVNEKWIYRADVSNYDVIPDLGIASYMPKAFYVKCIKK